MSKLLIVDDDKDVLLASRVVLKKEFEFIKTESDPFKLQPILLAETFDVILLDMNFSTGTTSGKEGIYWLREILKIDPQANIILITAYGDLNLAVEAMKIGAIDFVVKPWDNEKLVATVKSALRLSQSKSEIRELKNRQKVLKDELDKSHEKIIGKSKIMTDLMELVRKVAPTNANVLILGENGTGKELIARAIHRHSNRSDQIFVNLDIGAVANSLFESELFGHVKGSFTDAQNDRQGRIEAAAGGTLFLDEIGNLNLAQQSKLLSALEKREIYRLGSNTPTPIDIRLISATNLSYHELNDESIFRKDLLYRINTVQIELPPLRERKEDIPLLIKFFTKKYLKQYDKSGIKFSKEAIKKLSKYHWPGNIRELKHLVARAIIMCNDNIIREEDIWLNIEQENSNENTVNIEELEKNAIKKALTENSGNLTKTAKALGLGRTTLYRKMNKYDL